jgi:hypothetical protein
VVQRRPDKDTFELWVELLHGDVRSRRVGRGLLPGSRKHDCVATTAIMAWAGLTDVDLADMVRSVFLLRDCPRTTDDFFRQMRLFRGIVAKGGRLAPEQDVTGPSC